MSPVLKKGSANLTLTFVVFIVILLVALVPFRTYLDLATNHTAWRFGINLNNIATNSYVNWINSQSDEFISTRDALFLNKKAPPFDVIASSNINILGQQSPDDKKWIEVDLSDQKLYMKEGDTIVGNFLVSTGKWYPTPTGEWRIWTKLRYTRMKGGSKALGTFYDLPNVPYTMYYYKGYGIHGAYWHNDFGTPRSHGCVNMKPDEAGIVFNWAAVGTRVVVHQ